MEGSDWSKVLILVLLDLVHRVDINNKVQIYGKTVLILVLLDLVHRVKVYVGLQLAVLVLILVLLDLVHRDCLIFLLT